MKKEYEISKNLDIDGVARVERLEESADGFALNREDFGGISLKKIILTRALNFKDKLQIAVKITDILSRMHGCQIIHGNIKPSNIIINLHSGEVKITDVSGSRVYETDSSLSATSLPETLLYMSPEQTGRMNRMPDYRTDFYSLGITLYEMFAGEPPFRSDEPIEIIYWHIAQPPRSLSSLDPQIPAVLARIVDKLLAKNPEERYQSAYGIKYDLEKCLSLLDAKNRIPAFPIAEKDVSEYLNIPHKVYGRRREKDALRKAYERIARGKSELVLIHGNAGTGKTTLISETLRSIIHQDALFIEGKFDQIGGEIPYSGIIKALRGLIQQLLTQNREKLAAWKTELQAALGVNGRVILDIIPELELIIGEQPELPDLGTAETKNVFDFVFLAFFKVFTRKEHPLVMFLDDLQYADPASLRLMEMVLTEAESRHFCLAGAYRENEVETGHPLLFTLANIQKANVFTETISLGPLGNEEIMSILSDMLSRNPQELGRLAALILKKTGGNAFFVNQFIGKIHRNALLTFNIKEGCWHWDLEAIEQMSVTDNVTDLLIERLNTMPKEVRSMMSLAACMGSTFHPLLLAEVLKVPTEDIIRPLKTAVQEGFLFPVRGLHPWELLQDESGILRFLHDRIQEACYALLGPKEVCEAHLSIGRTLFKKAHPEILEENLLEIVSHLLKGTELVVQENERLEIAGLTLKAGTRAKASTAYDQACIYLAAGMELVTENIWKTDYPFAFALYKERSECEYLAGNHEQAQKLFDLTLDRANSNLDQAEIYRIRMALDAKVGRFVEHQTQCIQALKLFGIHLPDLADKEAQEKLIAAEMVKINQILGDRRIADLIDLPVITDPEKIACQKLLMDALSSAYVSNPTFFAMGTVTLVNITLTYGINKDSNYTFVVWAMLLGTKFQQHEKAFELGSLALKLNERFQSTSNRCMVPFVIGNFINHWRRHIRYNMEYLREAFQAGTEIGDFVYGSFSAMSITRVALSYGHDPLESVLDDVETGLNFFKRIKNAPALERQQLVRQTVLNLLGLTRSSSSLNSDTFDEQAHLEKLQSIKYGTGVALFYLYKAQTLYLAGNFAEAMEMAEQARQNIAFMSGMMQESDCLLFHSLTITSLYSDAPEAQREKYDRELQNNQDRAKSWVDNCPENFLGRYLLVEAEIARVSGDFSRACRLYDEAIQSAEEHGFTFLAALANELAAKSYLAQGTVKAARNYLDDALGLYRKWGAQGKARDLEEKYVPIIKPRLKEGMAATAKPPLANDFTPSRSTKGLFAEMVDLASIIKLSQAISEEIHFNRLIEKLMKILIENAGAQSGFLFIEREGTLCIFARENSAADTVVMETSMRLDDASQAYPRSMIQYVQRTGEQIVLNDAADTGLFVADPYIASKRPGSILCMPIVERAKTAGILYLENRLLKDAFTPERIKTLELLSSQAAISIRNSLNYEDINRNREKLQESKEKLQESVDEYSNLFKNIQDVFYRSDMAGNIILVSPSIKKIFGYTMEEASHLNLLDIYRDPGQRRLLETHLQEKGYIENFETELKRKDGSYIWVSANSHLIVNKQGHVVGIEGMVRDITIRKKAEQALQERDALFARLSSQVPGMLFQFARRSDGQYCVPYSNEGIRTIFGCAPEDVRDGFEPIFQAVSAEDRGIVTQTIEASAQNISPWMCEYRVCLPGQPLKWILGYSTPEKFPDGSIVWSGYNMDITERKRSEAERVRLQEQLLQSQKLEAVGVLAGGVAHDFNNILAAIIGYAELTMGKMDAQDPLRKNVAKILDAAMRSANITRQLLAFARKQVIAPVLLDINESVEAMLKMIHRLIGENIELVWLPGKSPSKIMMDPSQLDQVLLNLCVNAKDAIDGIGKITIETDTAYFGDISSLSDTDRISGEYAVLSVIDNGHGMDKETQKHIFEPFFTTKEMGKGTGMGLATVYGIVRQNKGFINLYSELETGTTFKIYIPLHSGASPEETKTLSLDLPRSRGETILLVEDDPMILEMSTTMLKNLGYSILFADTPREAIRIAGETGSPIHLLITDVVMPEMNGKDLAQRLVAIRPNIKCLFMSGYTADVIAPQGILDESVQFIAKPFLLKDLAIKIREVLR